MMIKKIYGAPGTGKTTRMLDLLQQEIENDIPLERIAFITHTVAAKIEVITRIQSILKIVDEKTQLRYFRTIHGVCYVENELKRDNVMQSEDYLIFGEIIGIPFSTNFTTDYDMDGLPIGFNLSGGNEILACRQYAAAHCVDISSVPMEWPIWASPKLMREVITKYKAYKYKHAKFDFVDMLHLYEKYGESLDIDVMFIDEAQDLSILQWKIVNKMMGKAKRVYIAGDDDQSIYSFIGSDPYGFLHYESDSYEILPVSYRLKDNIWEYALKIISQVSERQPKIIKTRGPGGEITYYNSDLLYLDIDTGQSTMIMARHHKQLQRLAKSLETRGIPYKGKGIKIHGTDHAVAIHAYFRAKKGENISLREASIIAKYANEKIYSKQLRQESRNNPDLFIDKEHLNINWNAPWEVYLSRTKAEIMKNEIMKNILNNVGLKGIIEEPSVSITTYHGSKGRQADHVICMTDCFRKAYEGAMINPDGERRLAYVGVTRAKEKLTIIPPVTDMWMRSMI